MKTTKKLRIIIETDVSAWTAEQIAAYQQMVLQLLAGDGNAGLGDKSTVIYEQSEEQ